MSDSNQDKSILDLDMYKNHSEIAAILDIEALRYIESEDEIYFRKIENILKRIDSYLRITITRDDFQKGSDGSINVYTRYYLDTEYQIKIIDVEFIEFNIHYKIVPKMRKENGASAYYNNSQIVSEAAPTIIDINIKWNNDNHHIMTEQILIREIFRQLYLNASLPIRELLSNYKAKLLELKND